MPTAAPAPPVAPARPELWRVTDRASFLALRRGGRRARSGPLTVTYLAAAGPAPERARVAFAVGKATGGAVVRNRVRRRLRAALRQLAVDQALPSGTYLWGAGAAVASLPWSELVELVRSVVAEVTR